MNDPLPTDQNALEEVSEAAEGCCNRAIDCVRTNPTATILAALGAGIVTGVLIRGLLQCEEETRSEKIMNELQRRLQSIASPVVETASDLAARGQELLASGLASGGDRWCGLKKNLGKMFNR